MSSATIRRLVAVLGAGVLGILFLCAPVWAGPGNGHQKSSNGSTQGASHSNPDGGGVDKPYAAAGQEARSQGESDWDGNNGCGNDDDREDDNNGWCGRKPAGDSEDNNAAAGSFRNKGVSKKVTHEVKAGVDSDSKLASRGAPDAQVMGVQFEAAAATTTAAAAAAPAPGAVAGASDSGVAGRGTEVLGVQVSRGEALAATGVPVLLLALAGLVLVVGGAGLRRWGRPRAER